MEKFKGKYRIPSARWADWNYGQNAAYFVTICTSGGLHSFGEVTNCEMVLSSLGQTAVDCWKEIPEHFQFVVLGEFMVMPNPVHGIVVIDKPETGAGRGVETQDIASLQRGRLGPQSQNLASIVRGYKIGVTKFARQNDIPFAWQERYYDHIIRSPEDYRRIAQYILDNPVRWVEDEFNGLG